ncbi:MAG: terminase large subunit [Chromatiales bacterium]|nr:terminase large subunit [Chromatiales bacterium]
MLAAIRTGLGKVPDSRLISLGTRPSTDTHWFAKMLTGAGVRYAQIHAGRKTDPHFRLRTWRRANPSLDHLPSLAKKLREEAEHAKTDPAALASFIALRLNGGVSDIEVASLLDAGTWERIEGEAGIEGRPVWGVDLGTSAAMSAVAAYWPASGRLETVGAFPLVPSLEERGLRDGVGRLYLECHRRGELILAGEHAVSVEHLLREAIERFGAPTAIAADRWREAELRDALKAAAVPLAVLELRGMGFKDGGADVEAFRRAVGEGKVIPSRSLLLTAAMGEARTIADPAGNSKLSKATEGGRRRNARDDAAAAAILAVALGTRRGVRRGGAYLGAA